MNWWQRLRKAGQLEDRLDAELRYHFERQIQDHIRAGVPESEARRRARLDFGGMEQVKEECRDARGSMWAEAIWKDIRFAWRILWRSPGFALAAIGTLALGIGASTAIFNVVNTTFLHALPYPDPDGLLWITERNTASGHNGAASYPNFLDWRAQQNAFSELSIYQIDSQTLTTGGLVERIPVLAVSQGFFAALGARAVQGRQMSAEDDQPGASPVVWISHAAWLKYFGADPRLVGNAISLDGRSVVVAGILPTSFRFMVPAEAYLPMAPYAQRTGLTDRMSRANTSVIGRLKPGVALEAARAQLNSIGRRLERQYPEANTSIAPTVVPLRERVAGSARTQLLLLMCAVGILLLIACANLANMLLARSTSRRREMAVRISLGAGRLQLVRQLLAESLLLAALGGLAGGLFGLGASRFAVRLEPSEIQQISGVGAGIDFRVLLFLVSVTVATGIGFGLAPAWQSSKVSTSGAMKGVEYLVHAPGGRFRATDLLVVSQVALSFTLLVGAGLMIRSLDRLARVDPGFRPESVLTLKLPAPLAESFLRNPFTLAQYFTRILDTAGGQPAVGASALITTLPFTWTNSSTPIYPEGRPESPADAASDISFHLVTADYFRAMGIPLLRGRLLSEREPQPAVPPGFDAAKDYLTIFKDFPLHAVISERMATQYWTREDPIGKRFRLRTAPGQPQPLVQVVGVVGDTAQFGLDQVKKPEFYLSLYQFPVPAETFLVIRTRTDPGALAASMRAALQPIVGDQPISDVQPMAARIADTLSGRRFNTGLWTFFAGTALLLALLGVYGVLAFIVGRRTREIGIRVALGASRAGILRGVLWKGYRLVVPGIVVGLAGAWGVGRLLGSSLFGIGGSDAITYAGSAGMFLLVALFACLLPARRAAKADPVAALRCQ